MFMMPRDAIVPKFKLNESKVASDLFLHYKFFFSLLSTKISAKIQVEYHVRWVGYSWRFNKWMPKESLDCEELIVDFEKKRAIKILGKFYFAYRH